VRRPGEKVHKCDLDFWEAPTRENLGVHLTYHPESELFLFKGLVEMFASDLCPINSFTLVPDYGQTKLFQVKSLPINILAS
jgi:hypothetical protein